MTPLYRCCTGLGPTHRMSTAPGGQAGLASGHGQLARVRAAWQSRAQAARPAADIGRTGKIISGSGTAFAHAALQSPAARAHGSRRAGRRTRSQARVDADHARGHGVSGARHHRLDARPHHLQARPLRARQRRGGSMVGRLGLRAGREAARSAKAAAAAEGRRAGGRRKEGSSHAEQLRRCSAVGPRTWSGSPSAAGSTRLVPTSVAQTKVSRTHVPLPASYSDCGRNRGESGKAGRRRRRRQRRPAAGHTRAGHDIADALRLPCAATRAARARLRLTARPSRSPGVQNSLSMRPAAARVSLREEAVLRQTARKSMRVVMKEQGSTAPRCAACAAAAALHRDADALPP